MTAPFDCGPCEGCLFDTECTDLRASHPEEVCLLAFWRREYDIEVRAHLAALGVSLE